MSINNTPITLTLIIDPIGILFSCTVLFISANVLRFSTIYIAEDKYINRFTVLVLLFILSINLLIFLPHFIILLLGWDGLGIVSFILVIYYQSPKSLAAGIITALTNRIGDVILLLSIAWTLNQGHWFIINIRNTNYSTAQIICIAVAAITKSAQIPFSRWLPAAIAAPTPVSALVHSSTLVTAGVFLTIRFYPFLHSHIHFNKVILLIAVLTILMAGLSATTEHDIKKIIALSTLSQLGLIMTRIGLNCPQLAFFHIVTHALFKALLFICAGSFINQHYHTQDLRWMGNLTHQIPVATSCITVANFALCGFPFIAGFYSKDLIIETAINLPTNIIMSLFAIYCVGLTTYYSFRFSVPILWTESLGAPFINITEYKAITTPIVLLASLSITVGSMLRWVPPLTQFSYIIPTIIKLTPLLIIGVGVAVGYASTFHEYDKVQVLGVKNGITFTGSCAIWFLVPLSTQFIIAYPYFIAHNYLKSIDQGWLEIYSGNGFHSMLTKYNNAVLQKSPKSPISFLASSLVVVWLVLIIIYLYC